MVDKDRDERLVGSQRAADLAADAPGDPVAEFIVGAVEAHPRDLVRAVTEKFGISRQAVHRKLSGLVRDELIQASGQTRSRRYAPGPVRKRIAVLKVTSGLDEYRSWTELVEPQLTGLPENVVSLCRYGVTEMLNNVVDHSESQEATVAIKRTPRSIELQVQDRGVGIFHKIKTECGLANEHEAILELAKGKLTTDPERHTGEGIFFSSRMFDDFTIESGTVVLLCLAGGETWLVEAREAEAGTFVSMQISPESRRTTQEVFERFASAKDGFSFDRTHLVVKLVEPEGSALVSRSQAKRILARLERFKEVILDFAGVESVTPAFADEIFRVFASTHPQVQLMPVNDNEQVRLMIRRAVSGREEQAQRGERGHRPS
jgi:anti-sigma regulatory factor (Ser/Thr protein kinase)